MKQKTYLEYRKEFLNQYSKIEKNELGFVRLEQFKIRSFSKFLFLFSLDFVDCDYNNVVSSLGIKQFIVRKIPVSLIKINSQKSMFDKFEGQFERAIRYYYDNFKND